MIYLVQRGHIRKPYSEFKNKPLSSAVQLEYMGSAEFEWGALPKSLGFMQANFDRYETSKWNGCDRPDDFVLRIWHPFGDGTPELQDYKEQLFCLFEGKTRTKEWHNFVAKPTSSNPEDFWWDIKNHVMWSYDKWFMNNLQDYLQASFKIMEDSK